MFQRDFDSPHCRIQRCAILETSSLHEQLLIAACGQEDSLPVQSCTEHRQKLALSVLTWVVAVQMNDVAKG